MPKQKILFQYYSADISKPNPIGWISLEKFIDSIKEPKPEILELFDKIERAASEGNLQLKDRLKSKLYYFTPCVKLNGSRCYSNITDFTGLMVLDFDKIDNAEEFKQFLFNAIPSIVCGYLSPSKKGVKFLVKIPLCYTVDEFKSYFYGIAYHLEKYKGFDPTTQNCVLPLYFSKDAGILTRDYNSAETWTTRGIKTTEFKEQVGEVVPADNISDESRRIIKTIITNMMGGITDTAHYIVRNSSLVLGGYVGSGYYTQEEAEEIMKELIFNTPYCKKNFNGYVKTSVDMIARGALSPLYVEYE